MATNLLGQLIAAESGASIPQGPTLAALGQTFGTAMQEEETRRREKLDEIQAELGDYDFNGLSEADAIAAEAEVKNIEDFVVANVKDITSRGGGAFKATRELEKHKRDLTKNILNKQTANSELQNSLSVAASNPKVDNAWSQEKLAKVNELKGQGLTNSADYLQAVRDYQAALVPVENTDTLINNVIQGVVADKSATASQGAVDPATGLYTTTSTTSSIYNRDEVVRQAMIQYDSFSEAQKYELASQGINSAEAFSDMAYNVSQDREQSIRQQSTAQLKGFSNKDNTYKPSAEERRAKAFQQVKFQFQDLNTLEDVENEFKALGPELGVTFEGGRSPKIVYYRGDKKITRKVDKDNPVSSAQTILQDLYNQGHIYKGAVVGSYGTPAVSRGGRTAPAGSTQVGANTKALFVK